MKMYYYIPLFVDNVVVCNVSIYRAMSYYARISVLVFLFYGYSHGMSHCPCRLQVETASHGIHIEHLAGKYSPSWSLLSRVE